LLDRPTADLPGVGIVTGLSRRRAIVALGTALAVATGLTASAAPDDNSCLNGPWTLVGTDTFTLPQGLLRSQGVTSDGSGWLFSWQGGVSRTDETYLTLAANTLPPDVAVDQPSLDPATGHNHVGGNHMGDIDVQDGLVYAPVEDGGQSIGVTDLNDPEYQRPFIALYDAKTLAYTGRRYPLPLELQAAGVPWVAVDHRTGEVYTDEWDMPHDRLNVYGGDFRFRRFIDLHYPDELGAGFHLSRIQGAKVLGHTMYATRDDAAKTVFAIDLRTGKVSRLFSLNPTVPAELEGLAVRRTPDGALLHVLIVLDNDVAESLDFKDIRVAFEHFAPPRCAAERAA
jgi:hypothetical protein